MANREIAHIFLEMADMLELQGVQFKPRAYRNAALSIESLSEDVSSIYSKGGLAALQEIPGVGKNLAKKIEEFLKTGKVRSYFKLKKEFPVNLKELGAVGGIGPKKAMRLYHELGVKDLSTLEKAAKNGKIRKLPGFGEKSEQKILAGLLFAKSGIGRFSLAEASAIVRDLKEKFQGCEKLDYLEAAGSYRRGKETVGDLDLLAISKNPSQIMKYFLSMYPSSSVIMQGEKRSSIRLPSGIQVDLRVFSSDEFGSALMYFTGSKEHNVGMRKIAISKGMKLSEYGLFSGKRRVAGKTEEEIYKKLGMCFIPPELRENRGELEAAAKGTVPKLVEQFDIKGDLHCHSEWSRDASGSLEELAKAAQSLNYEYLLISDHGGSEIRIVNGLDEKKLRKQMVEIDQLNKKLNGITLLKGVEANILKDGRIDLPDSILRDLDIVLASIHSNFFQPPQTITKRIISAMENEHVDIIAHPTGRLIGSRPPSQMDFGVVFDTAKRTGTALEINCQPGRMDLDAQHIFSAREKVSFTLGSDCHSPFQLHLMEFGVRNARRGWCTKKNILNCLSLKNLRKRFGF